MTMSPHSWVTPRKPFPVEILAMMRWVVSLGCIPWSDGRTRGTVTGIQIENIIANRGSELLGGVADIILEVEDNSTRDRMYLKAPVFLNEFQKEGVETGSRPGRSE